MSRIVRSTVGRSKMPGPPPLSPTFFQPSSFDIALDPFVLAPLVLPERKAPKSGIFRKKNKELDQEREARDKREQDQHKLLAGLASKYNTLIASCKALIESHNELKNRIDEGQQREADLERILDQLSRNLDDTKNETLAGDDRLERARRRIATLETMLESEQKEREALEDTRRKLERQLRLTKRQSEMFNKGAIAAAANTDSPVQSQDHQVKALRETVLREQQLGKEILKAKKDLEKKVMALEDAGLDKDFLIEKLERKLNAADQENSQLKMQLQDSSLADEFRDYRESKEKELMDLREQWLTAKEVVDSNAATLQRQLAEAKAKCESEEQNGLQHAARARKFEATVRTLKQQLDETTDKLSAAEKGQRRAEKEVHEVKQLLVEKDSTASPAAASSVAILQGEIQQLRNSLAKEQDTRKATEAALKEARSTAQENSLSLTEAKQVGTNLTLANKKLKAELDALVEELDEEHKAKEEMAHFRHILEQQLEESNRDKVALGNDRSRFEEALRRAERELASVRSDLQSEKESAARTKRTLQRKIDDLLSRPLSPQGPPPMMASSPLGSSPASDLKRQHSGVLYRQQLEELTSQLQVEQRNRNEEEQEYRKTREDLLELSHAHRKAQRDLQEVTLQLESALEQIPRLHTSVRTANEQVDALRRQNDEKELSLDTVTAERDDLAGKVATLTQHLKEAKAERAKAEQEKLWLQGQLNTLKLEMGGPTSLSKRESLEYSNQHLEQALSSAQQWEKAAHRVQEELSHAQELLEEEIAAKNRAIAETEAKAAEAEKLRFAADDIRLQMIRLETSLKRAEEALAHSRNALEDERQSKVALEAHRRRLDRSVQELTEQLETERLSLLKSSRSLAKLQSQNKQLSSQLYLAVALGPQQTHEAPPNKLLVAPSELNASLAIIRAQLEAEVVERVRLEATLRSAQSQQDLVRYDRSQLNSVLLALRAEPTPLPNEVDDSVSARLAHFEAENSVLKADQQETKIMLDEIRADLFSRVEMLAKQVSTSVDATKLHEKIAQIKRKKTHYKSLSKCRPSASP